ncbi:hypothetical protein NQ315_012290 [Exocentrus adspersus]|uniref:Uncharacterized protein n=1 Tax=Exocentrus adspersus TaxID=1586481 RepID=A0AAV8VEX2_9CUCU|nr:hypothetical protein NQ315_012290 [Exocentrus adspersus]
MEQGYLEAKSDNLPIIDPFMISVFFMDNMKYLSAEIKSVKNVRVTRVILESSCWLRTVKEGK